jgi:PilZ domain
MSFLGKMFSSVQIEIVTFNPDDSSILFQSEKPLKVGDHNAKAKVGDLTLKCKVRLESTEADLHYGTFLSPGEALEPLGQLLPRPKVFSEQRAHERIDRVIRISSAAIPDFQATTLDLSLSGAKVKTNGPMKANDFFECTVEFDDYTMARLNLIGQVRWCREVGETWQVGVEFVEMQRDTRSRLAYFIKALESVERGVITGSYQVFD